MSIMSNNNNYNMEKLLFIWGKGAAFSANNIHKRIPIIFILALS